MAADALPQLFRRALPERLDLPQTLAAADVVEEVPENPAAIGSMADLGMELQTEHWPGSVPDRRNRASIGSRQRHEVPVDRLHLVAVAHPDDSVLRHAG